MLSGIHSLVRGSAAAARVLALAIGSALVLAAPLAAQARDARLPEAGRLWLELAPTLLDWSEQFALDPQDGDLTDGDREPLSAHYDGLIAARLFPGPDVFLADLNADADALGYTPIPASDFSFGSLDFQRISAEVRRLDVGFEFGIFDRLSVGVNAPFTMTDVETAFRFDSTTATVASAAVWLPPSDPFFTDAQTALTALQGLIDGGTLSGMALSDAIALRDAATTFVGALEGRAMNGALIPTAMSPAGLEMGTLYGGFVSGFDALGLTLPALALPDAPGRADLVRFFEDAPIAAFAPGGARNGLRLGEVEVGVRLGLLDQITVREADPTEPDSAGGARPARRSGVRFRTTAGVTVRIPLLSASFPPFANAANFFDVPIGDGQTDIELALYQDVAVAGWLLLRSAARYGIQRPDDLILRVAPPDRPFALESLQTVVHRDLGDYLAVAVRPGLRLNRTLSIGLGWDYFRLGAPAYTLTEPLPDVPDASPLEVEATQTRHRVGLEFVFDNSQSRNREEILAGRTTKRAPWQFGVGIHRSIAGSGGRTPAAFRFGASFRIPIQVF